MSEPLSDANRADWDGFVDASTSLWLWARSEWADYCSAYGTRRGPGHLERAEAGAVISVQPEWPTHPGTHLVTDLSTEMWRGLRKGHQAAVRATLGAHAPTLKIRAGWFDEYARLHRQTFGQVRTLESYAAQERLLERGLGFVLVAEDQEHLRAAALFYVYKDGAYYASAPRCREHDEVSGSHALIWVAMANLQRRGTMWLDFGPVPTAAATPKELSVYAFKHGFGGVERSVS